MEGSRTNSTYCSRFLVWSCKVCGGAVLLEEAPAAGADDVVADAYLIGGGGAFEDMPHDEVGRRIGDELHPDACHAEVVEPAIDDVVRAARRALAPRPTVFVVVNLRRERVGGQGCEDKDGKGAHPWMLA